MLSHNFMIFFGFDYRLGVTSASGLTAAFGNLIKRVQSISRETLISFTFHPTNMFTGLVSFFWLLLVKTV